MSIATFLSLDFWTYADRAWEGGAYILAVMYASIAPLEVIAFAIVLHLHYVSEGSFLAALRKSRRFLWGVAAANLCLQFLGYSVGLVSVLGG
jgi:hypothetical protein